MDQQVIPPVDESAGIPLGATCQEASMFTGNMYVPCGGVAVAIVRSDKDQRSYLMCLTCADHNVRNRGCKLLSTTDGVLAVRHKLLRIAKVMYCDNGMVAVFDENGHQIPEYQGPYREARSSVLHDADDRTVFDSWPGIQTGGKKPTVEPW